jgi:hypothetical protein
MSVRRRGRGEGSRRRHLEGEVPCVPDIGGGRDGEDIEVAGAEDEGV